MISISCESCSVYYHLFQFIKQFLLQHYGSDLLTMENGMKEIELLLLKKFQCVMKSMNFPLNGTRSLSVTIT
jgi:hypothetical protein